MPEPLLWACIEYGDSPGSQVAQTQPSPEARGRPACQVPASQGADGLEKEQGQWGVHMAVCFWESGLVGGCELQRSCPWWRRVERFRGRRVRTRAGVEWPWALAHPFPGHTLCPHPPGTLPCPRGLELVELPPGSCPFVRK